MQSSGAVRAPVNLPVAGNLTLWYVVSLIIALLMIIASLAGLLYPDQLYPTAALRQSFMATDVVNLLIGLPILLGSIWFARRGKLPGLLFWPGALLYVLYHYIVYTFSLPLNVGFLLALVLLGLSVYTTIGLVASIDGQAVRRRLAGNVPERIAGGALTGLGLAFALLVLSTIIGALLRGTDIAKAELGLHVSDFIISQAWIIGGVLLWRREPLGYVTGAGLLFQASLLFVGLLVYFALQPLLTGTPLPVEDFVVIFAMGLICFVPFGLFVRGVGKGERSEG
jgi:hypothetical protein